MMGTLKASLNVLCNNENVRGVVVITKEGMVIESNMDDTLSAESLGAFMSQIALTIKNSLFSLGYNDFTRYVIQSNQCKIYLVDLGKSVLILITDIEIDQGKINVALYQAANEIKKTWRLDV